MRHFCTYFDRHYLSRGLALYESLRRHAQPFSLYVLCFDDYTYQFLAERSAPGLHAIALEDFEEGDADLQLAKANRRKIEYYFTCTPSLALHILDHVPDVEILTYLDADLYFFADPAPLFAEIEDHSVLIVGHRFPDNLRYLESYGIYNVGYLSFRNDASGRECLRWWRERCLEWCYNRLEEDRYADQKYLDQWPTRFQRVAVARHRGAGLAPWNFVAHPVSQAEAKLWIGADPLIFVHFHALKILRGPWFDPGVAPYRVYMSSILRRRVFLPYVRTVRRLSRESGTLLVEGVRLTRGVGLVSLLRRFVRGEVILALGTFSFHINYIRWVRAIDQFVERVHGIIRRAVAQLAWIRIFP